MFITIFLILGLVVIGEVAGVVVGRGFRGAIRNHVLRTVDSIAGVVLQIVAVMVAAWLLASPLQKSGHATLARACEDSAIRSTVDRAAPGWLKKVPTNLANLFSTTGISDVWRPFGQTPIMPVDAPDANLATQPGGGRRGAECRQDQGSGQQLPEGARRAPDSSSHGIG